MSNLHISISAEPIFHIGSVPITNSILSSWLVSILLIAISLWISKNIKNTKRPKGLQNVFELIIESLYNLTIGITESAVKTKYIFPFVLSFFLFIILNNWFGLLPGVGTIGFQEKVEEDAHVSYEIPMNSFATKTYASSDETTPVEEEKTVFVPFFRAGTADINTTLALAIISCVSTWVLGIKFLGVHYFDRFKNPLELISEFSRLISFTFRLFGNIFAGEVLIAVMTSLVPIIIPSVFIGMEIFVGTIQAFVFSILTLIFMNLAMESHGGEAHAKAA